MKTVQIVHNEHYRGFRIEVVFYFTGYLTPETRREYMVFVGNDRHELRFKTKEGALLWGKRVVDQCLDQPL